jgi:hypothetical protein
MRTYFLWTIGCQMNYADSWRLEQALRRLGYQEAPRAEQADLVVLNTCVVRQHAEDRCVGRLTSLKGWKRRRANALLAVMGCFVGDAEELRVAYPYVDLFLKPSDYMGLVHYLYDRDLLPPDDAVALPATEEVVPVSMHVPFACVEGKSAAARRTRPRTRSARWLDGAYARSRCWGRTSILTAATCRQCPMRGTLPAWPTCCTSCTGSKGCTASAS